jgi:hypothetical protein
MHEVDMGISLGHNNDSGPKNSQTMRLKMVGLGKREELERDKNLNQVLSARGTMKSLSVLLTKPPAQRIPPGPSVTKSRRSPNFRPAMSPKRQVTSRRPANRQSVAARETTLFQRDKGTTDPCLVLALADAPACLGRALADISA